MKHYLFSHTKKRQYILLIIDMLVLSFSIFISYTIRVFLNQRHPSLADVLSKFNLWQIIVVLTHLFTLYLLDQYNLDRLVNLIRSSMRVIMSVFLAALMISGTFFFLPKYVFGRQVLLIHIGVTSFTMILWRLFFINVLIRGKRPKQLALLGNGKIVSSFVEEIGKISNGSFKVANVCILDHSSKASCPLPDSTLKHDNFLDLLKNDDFDMLAFDSTNGSLSNDEIRQILQLKYKGKAVYDLSTLYKNLTGKVPLSYINGQWLFSNYGFQGEVSKPYLRIKRFIDICLSSILLNILSPFILIIMLLLKTGGKGSILYAQKRLGKNRKPFICYKFRTMIEGAEKLSGPVWSSKNDPRITRFGKFLRKTRLDELPQLFNILKGEMSFVGPRPIREYFAIQMAEKVPFYWLRYDVKPGVTGWAQVNGVFAVPDGLEAFQYELFYIQNMSLFLDLLTMFKTFQTLIWKKGK